MTSRCAHTYFNADCGVTLRCLSLNDHAGPHAMPAVEHNLPKNKFFSPSSGLTTLPPVPPVPAPWMLEFQKTPAYALASSTTQRDAAVSGNLEFFLPKILYDAVHSPDFPCRLEYIGVPRMMTLAVALDGTPYHTHLGCFGCPNTSPHVCSMPLHKVDMDIDKPADSTDIFTSGYTYVVTPWFAALEQARRGVPFFSIPPPPRPSDAAPPPSPASPAPTPEMAAAAAIVAKITPLRPAPLAGAGGGGGVPSSAKLLPPPMSAFAPRSPSSPKSGPIAGGTKRPSSGRPALHAFMRQKSMRRGLAQVYTSSSSAADTDAMTTAAAAPAPSFSSSSLTDALEAAASPPPTRFEKYEVLAARLRAHVDEPGKYNLIFPSEFRGDALALRALADAKDGAARRSANSAALAAHNASGRGGKLSFRPGQSESERHALLMCAFTSMGVAQLTEGDAAQTDESRNYTAGARGDSTVYGLFSSGEHADNCLLLLATNLAAVEAEGVKLQQQSRRNRELSIRMLTLQHRNFSVFRACAGNVDLEHGPYRTLARLVEQDDPRFQVFPWDYFSTVKLASTMMEEEEGAWPYWKSEDEYSGEEFEEEKEEEEEEGEEDGEEDKWIGKPHHHQ